MLCSIFWGVDLGLMERCDAGEWWVCRWWGLAPGTLLFWCCRAVAVGHGRAGHVVGWLRLRSPNVLFDCRFMVVVEGEGQVPPPQKLVSF